MDRVLFDGGGKKLYPLIHKSYLTKWHDFRLLRKIQYTTSLCSAFHWQPKNMCGQWKVLRQEHGSQRCHSKLLNLNCHRITGLSEDFLDKRHFSTSSHNQGPDKKDDKRSSNEESDEDKREREWLEDLPILILTQGPSLLSMFVLFVLVYGKLKQIQQEAGLGEFAGYVTSVQFYKELLEKGEVQCISTLEWPFGFKSTCVSLFPGACVNGVVHENKVFVKVDSRSFNANDVLVWEKSKGIKTGILFEKRDSHLLIYCILLCSLGMLLSTKNNFKSSQMAKNQPGWKPKEPMEKPEKPPNFFDMFKPDMHYIRGDELAGKGKLSLKFKDIAGLKEAKVEVMEFVDYLKNPMRFQRLGAKIPHGVLLLGPPGCGKTLLAKAVAAEANNVPFYAMAGSEFVEIIGGLGASRVRTLFEKARKNSPSIIYIDEIDAIGKKRQNMPTVDGISEEDQTLNQLLVEMDGIGTEAGVIVLASTNRADILDQALLRAGRFDRHILVDLPTMIERLELFEMYLSKIKLDFAISQVAPRLAQLTPGMSGADISNVCNEAAIHAATNHEKSVKVGDIDYAIQRILAGAEKRSYVADAREKKINAYYEAGRTVVAWMTETSDAILKISIVPRAKFRLGYYQHYAPERFLQTDKQLFEKMCVHLAGIATEALVFKNTSSASEKDLETVRKLAYSCVREFGMNETIGQVSFNTGDDEIKPYSKYLGNLIDMEVRNLVAKASQHSKKLLQDNMDKVNKVASALLEKETLSYEDIENLIGPPPYGSKKPKLDELTMNVS